MPPDGRKSHTPFPLCERWYFPSWTQQEIADAVGVAQDTLKDTFREFGDIAKIPKTDQASAEHATDFEVPKQNGLRIRRLPHSSATVGRMLPVGLRRFLSDTRRYVHYPRFCRGLLRHGNGLLMRTSLGGRFGEILPGVATPARIIFVVFCWYLTTFVEFRVFSQTVTR